MIGHINGGYIIHNEFRSGNIAPADHNLGFVKRCEEQLPKDKPIHYLRADSASYQAKLFDYCQQKEKRVTRKRVTGYFLTTLDLMVKTGV